MTTIEFDERIKDAANKAGLTGSQRNKFILFCKTWNDNNGEMFYGGYADEWAERFANRREYRHANRTRTEWLDAINEEIDNRDAEYYEE